jgi:DNA-binding transcriptional ArsR family regulator
MDNRDPMLDIYDYLKDHGSATNRDLTDADGVSPKNKPNVSKYLNEMEELGIVDYQRDGRTKIWTLTEKFREDEPRTIVRTETVVETVTETVDPYPTYWTWVQKHREYVGAILFGNLVLTAVFLRAALTDTLFLWPAELLYPVLGVGLGSIVVTTGLAASQVGENHE